MPYPKKLSESYKNICRKHGIQMYLGGGKIIKDLLVNTKDRDYHFREKLGDIQIQVW